MYTARTASLSRVSRLFLSLRRLRLFERARPMLFLFTVLRVGCCLHCAAQEPVLESAPALRDAMAALLTWQAGV
jgi:hypothetical protein